MASTTTSSTGTPSSQHNEVPLSSTTNSSRFLRFIKMLPIRSATKKVASKIKSIPIFRACLSSPLECEANYVDEQEHQMGTHNAHSDASVQEVAEGNLAKVSPVADNIDGAQVQNDHRKGSPMDMSKMPAEDVPVSLSDREGQGSGVTNQNDAGAPDIESPADVYNVQETRRVSLEQESDARSDSQSKITTPSDAVEGIDDETTGKKPVSSKIDQEDGLANEKLNRASSVISSKALLASELTEQGAKPESDDLSSETVDTVVSDNVAKGVAHEVEDAHDEIDSNAGNESPTFESGQLAMESSDLSANETSAEGSSLDSGVQNDTILALQSAATGGGAEKSCERAEKDDDAGLIQNSDGKEVPGRSEGLSKTELSNIDPEKSKRIERRRKMLAEKKEARLLWAMECAAREPVKVEHKSPVLSEVKSTSTERPIIAEKAHAEASSSNDTKMKAENESVDRTEEASGRARWSREEAQEARERRKRNQKERLLNLMEVCMANN